LQFGANGPQQFLCVERFFKKKPFASRRFVLRGYELMAAGNQDYRESWPEVPDDLLKREPVSARHANVRDYAVNFGNCRTKELLCRSEPSDAVTGRLQQIFSDSRTR
jgi:hypothetical protein